MNLWTSLDLTLDTGALPQESQAAWRDRWETPPGGHPTLPVTVRLADFPDLPGEARPVTVSNARVPVRTDRDAVQIGDAQLHLTPGHATLTLRTPDLPEVTALLLLSELHRAHGWLPLHAATVARNGHAVSISGPSGAGKSTAALRLAGLEYDVLAEDQTWLHPQTRRVHGLDRWLRAYPDSVQRFAPHLLGQSAGQDVYGKHLLPLNRNGTGATLEALLLLGHEPDLTPAQLTRLLWEATGMPLLTRTRQVTAHGIGELIRNTGIHGTGREGLLEQARHSLGVDR